MPAGSGLGVAQALVSTVLTSVAVSAAACAVPVAIVAAPPATSVATTTIGSRRYVPIRTTLNRATTSEPSCSDRTVDHSAANRKSPFSTFPTARR